MVVFRQKWSYLGKVVVFGKKVVLVGQKWFYSANAVVFGQWLLYSDKSGCTRAKWL